MVVGFEPVPLLQIGPHPVRRSSRDVQVFVVFDPNFQLCHLQMQPGFVGGFA